MVLTPTPGALGTTRGGPIYHQAVRDMTRATGTEEWIVVAETIVAPGVRIVAAALTAKAAEGVMIALVMAEVDVSDHSLASDVMMIAVAVTVTSDGIMTGATLAAGIMVARTVMIGAILIAGQVTIVEIPGTAATAVIEGKAADGMIAGTVTTVTETDASIAVIAGMIVGHGLTAKIAMIHGVPIVDPDRMVTDLATETELSTVSLILIHRWNGSAPL